MVVQVECVILRIFACEPIRHSDVVKFYFAMNCATSQAARTACSTLSLFGTVPSLAWLIQNMIRCHPVALWCRLILQWMAR